MFFVEILAQYSQGCIPLSFVTGENKVIIMRASEYEPEKWSNQVK